MHTTSSPDAAEQLKARVRAYFHRAYVLGDASVIDELIHPDILTYGLGPGPLHGRGAFKEWYTPFRASFSDIACAATHCFIEGDWVTVRIEFSGTHTGGALGPPPSGKKVHFSALILLRVKDGMVVEGYNEFDQLALMKTIGGI